MKKLLVSLTVLIITGISLSSCMKETKEPDAGFNISGLGINSTILLEVPLDVYLQADRAIRFQRDSIIAKSLNSPAPFSFKIGYINVTVSSADTTTYPKTILVDFGSDPLMPYQGSMSILMDGNMRNSGSTCAITYLNLITFGNPISGNDSILSSGKNSSGSIVSHFKMHGWQLKGYNDVEKLTFSGNVIGKYNLLSNANVMDSVQVNATDINLNTYKVYSIPSIKLQIDRGCNYFKTGVIYADITIKNSLAGKYVFDFGYSSMNNGTVNACDADGLINVTSKINVNYNQNFGFYVKEFK